MLGTTWERWGNYAGLALDAWTLQAATDATARQQARRHLAERLGRMRGLPQKLGQIFASTNGSEAADYSSLTDSAEPLPWEVIRPLLAEAWRCDPEQRLASISKQGLAASLGQVHRAQTKQGREIAVKIQFPGIRDALDSDLQLVDWLSLPMGGLGRGFDTAAYQATLRADLERELDYSMEAAGQREFAAAWNHDPQVIVPRVIPELSTARVLASDWENGDRWEEVLRNWTTSERRQLAELLARWFMTSLFRHGLVHADLHPGNIRFRRGPAGVQIVVYDFGCLWRPSPVERLSLLRLIRASIRCDESPWPCFLQLGFRRDLLTPLAPKLGEICRVLWEPFVAEAPYTLSQWRLSERLAEILGDDRWNFRIAAPASLLWLVRAMQGFKLYLEGLGQPVPFRRLLDPILQDLRGDLDRLTLPRDRGPAIDAGKLAKHLKIRVREAGTTKVELTSPASCIDNLEDWLDDELRAKLVERRIDLVGIVAGVRSRRYSPGPVFTLEEGQKQVAVWLE